MRTCFRASRHLCSRPCPSRCRRGLRHREVRDDVVAHLQATVDRLEADVAELKREFAEFRKQFE